MTPEDQILDALASHDAPATVRRAIESLDAYDTSRLRDLIRGAIRSEDARRDKVNQEP